jgi:AcrR family transcriptional regulator
MQQPSLPNTEIFNETQQRILDAAIRCVKERGVEKTNLNDIAKEAGVTRPTVYSYFPNRKDIIRTALLQSGYAFADRLLIHINTFKRTADRLVETVIFALNEMPKEPYLAIITKADLSEYINEDALSDEEGLAICLSLFQEIFKSEQINNDDLLEVTELTTRLMLSLLIMQGPVPRTEEELRAFLKKRLLPSVAL